MRNLGRDLHLSAGHFPARLRQHREQPAREEIEVDRQIIRAAHWFKHPATGHRYDRRALPRHVHAHRRQPVFFEIRRIAVQRHREGHVAQAIARDEGVQVLDARGHIESKLTTGLAGNEFERRSHGARSFVSRGEGAPVGEIQICEHDGERCVAHGIGGIAPGNRHRVAQAREQQQAFLLLATEIERAQDDGFPCPVHVRIVGELQVERRRDGARARQTECAQVETAPRDDALASLGEDKLVRRREQGAAEINSRSRTRHV